MATYSRDFLVPYLHDLCSLGIAEVKLKKQCNQLMSKKMKLEEEPRLPSPFDLPRPENAVSVGIVISILAGVFFLVGTISELYYWFSGDDSFGPVGTIMFGVLTVLFIGGAIQSIKVRMDSRKSYEKKVAKIEQHRRELKEAHQKNLALVPNYNNQISRCQAELRQVQELLHTCYNVNIIPSKYRNLYTIFYLYDWFSTSQADDLDMALNTFVLEEIKSRLDRMMDQMSDIILNQSIMAANQARALQTQQEQHDDLCDKLNKMEFSTQQQSVYLAMIESNTRATSYFAASDYFRRS